jgi:hypothetical protein
MKSATACISDFLLISVSRIVLRIINQFSRAFRGFIFFTRILPATSRLQKPAHTVCFYFGIPPEIHFTQHSFSQLSRDLNTKLAKVGKIADNKGTRNPPR